MIYFILWNLIISFVDETQNLEGPNSGIAICVDDKDNFAYFVVDGYMAPPGLPGFHYYWIQETWSQDSLSHIHFC